MKRVAWIANGLRAWALLAALIAASHSGAASQCQGRLGPQTGIAGKTEYDPFNPADLTEDHRLFVVNTGADPCVFALLFRSLAARPVLGGRLAYDLVGSGGTSLLTSATVAAAPLLKLKAPLAASATASLDFRIVIPRGQLAAPGPYRDAVELELYALGGDGRAAGPPLDRVSLAIAYSAARVLSVNIKGAELATTLGFGALTRGEERSVAIQARSNQSYELGVTSDNGGMLALTPRVAGQSWTVPYSVTLAGQRLDLARGAAALRAQPPTRPQSDASHDLTVTIGEVGQKRAGRYEDVLTVEIRAATP